MITVEEVVYNIEVTEPNRVAVVRETETNVIDAREVVMVTGGLGDMTKSIYDNDDDHVVDVSANTLKFNNKTADEFLQKNDIIDCGTF